MYIPDSVRDLHVPKSLGDDQKASFQMVKEVLRELCGSEKEQSISYDHILDFQCEMNSNRSPMRHAYLIPKPCCFHYRVPTLPDNICSLP